MDKPDGHIYHEIILCGDDDVHTFDIFREPDIQMDPNMLHYWLGTYIGKVVSSGGVFVGSFCLVYQEDCVPSKDDVKLPGIIACVIGVEEKSKQAIAALKYRVRIQNTRCKIQDKEVLDAPFRMNPAS